jgi:hypothetical protein
MVILKHVNICYKVYNFLFFVISIKFIYIYIIIKSKLYETLSIKSLFSAEHVIVG